jgi:thioredoxin-related protein
MIKYAGLLTIGFFLFFACSSPESKELPESAEHMYDSMQNAIADMDSVINRAGSENKHILIQVGGNWCPWCIRLHQFIESHPQIDSIIHADYIPLLINYSKENKNAEAMKRLEYPNRFGFPVLVILDKNGKRLHTQDTYFVEQGDSYCEEKIKRFLLNWNMKAVSPDAYQ